MTIGTDPEFFVKDKNTGKYVNAETMFPGTKQQPHMMTCGAGLQTDNVAVEFASPVAKDTFDLVNKLKATFGELFSMLPEGMELDTVPSVFFDEDQLQTEQAQRFGCSPSYDAWELKENEQPDGASTNMRSIGGHIHVGHEPGDGNEFLLDPYGKVDTVKTMDAFHGIISVVLDNDEAAVNRRKLYGSAGEHRPTGYGVEYRTLSAFWMKSPDLVMLMGSLTNDVLEHVREGKHNDIINEIGAETIVSVINEGKVEEAKNIMDNILRKYISDTTEEYLDRCLENIDNYNFMEEWS